MSVRTPPPGPAKKHARAQRRQLHQRWRLIGQLADDCGLGDLEMDTLRDLFTYLAAQVPYPLLGELPCLQGGHYYIEWRTDSNTVVYLKCAGVLMVLPPANA